VARLEQVKRVGTLIALTYVLTLEDPRRFRKSRDVGCYLGLHDQGVATRGRVSRNCTSTRKEIPICEPCWCRARTTFWIRLEWTAICDVGV
jgi:Transposase IS116/IS110/IS902 family